MVQDKEGGFGVGGNYKLSKKMMRIISLRNQQNKRG